MSITIPLLPTFEKSIHTFLIVLTIHTFLIVQIYKRSDLLHPKKVWVHTETLVQKENLNKTMINRITAKPV